MLNTDNLFDLNVRVPAKLASESNARHLSGIYQDSSVRKKWDSVYHLLFRQAVRKLPSNPKQILRKGLPLELSLPNIGPIDMYVRGEKFINYVLVKEIMMFNGFLHPAKDILFWHPSKKRRISSSADKNVRLTSKPREDDYILNDQSDNARENVNQDVIEAPPTFFRFANVPEVTTRKEDVQKSNTGSDVIMTTGRGGKYEGDQTLVSTQDSIVGGDTPPIDFQTLETIPVTEAIGLESLFEMIQVLKNTYSVSIRMSVMRVPLGKKFSIGPNGTRRSCAIVQINNGNGTRYIIEVARPDGWSISTLILRPIHQVDFRVIEHEFKLLIDGLVDKGGIGIRLC